MFKSFADFQSAAQNGYDNYLTSANALFKGFQQIAQENGSFARNAFEKGNEAAEQAAATKSFDKALQVQQAYVKESYEAFVAQTTKMNELYVATAKEGFKPFEAGMKAAGLPTGQQ